MITRQLNLNVSSLTLPRELNEAARKRERYGDSTCIAQELLLRFVLFSLKVCAVLSDLARVCHHVSCRLASKILKITQAHTKEAAAKSWRRNNLEAMEMPADDDDASDSGEVGKEEEFVQRLKRKAKEEEVTVFPLLSRAKNLVKLFLSGAAAASPSA